VTVRQIRLDELALERREVDGCLVRVGTTDADREAAGWTHAELCIYAGMTPPDYSGRPKKGQEVKDQLAGLRASLKQLMEGE
jgi:hypothetical protein